MDILTDNQKIIIQYASEIGCNPGEKVAILLNTWWPEAMEELIELCEEESPSDPAKLLEMSWQIYLKYKTEIDSVPECPEDEETEEYENTEAEYPEEAEEDYREDEKPGSTEPIYYLETADGDVMRVPESKLADFEAMNERRRAETERNAVSSQEGSSPEDKPKG